ncbi:MAG TPA: PAS domain-containing protein [Actinomycetota bacterium]|nr:PAS domain-containing protein [Actinomycetota bacterium]
MARLRDMEERYRTLVERLPVVAYSEDLEFDNPATEYVAPGIERLLGFTVAEWVGGPNLWRTLLHPDDRDRVLREWARLATGERSAFTMEYRIFRKDGSLVWLLDDAVVLDWRGRAHIEGMLQDITARKESEEALAQQARELTRANARLMELDELKTTFVITASHELRTPLTAVIGFMATLAERWNDLEEDERREFVQTVERQGRRLLRLVEDLLALSRLDAGDLRTRPIVMELAPLVDRAVAGFLTTASTWTSACWVGFGSKPTRIAWSRSSAG